jgi:myosin heavy subunit
MMMTQKSGQVGKQHDVVQETGELEIAKPRTAHQLYLHDHLHRMHNEIEMTTRKLELEKRRLNKLEDDVSRARVEHDEKVFKASASKATQNEPSTRKLEHKLAKAISELNNYNHENKDARNKIDQIRRERLQMNQVFKKLTSDIKENIVQVSGLQKESDMARREHEERLHRMTALKKQLEVERKNFKETVQKLQKEMKDREREELIQKVAMVRESLEHGDEDRKNKTRGLKADEEDNFNSTAVMRRILKLAFLNAIQRRHIRQHQKNIEVFDQAFATIRSTTGISDIEEIVKIFISLEQRNFSLLTYVNNLNRDIESLEKRNRNLEDQIQTAKKSEQDSEKHRTDILAELKQQIETTKASKEENLAQATSQQQVLDRCGPFIQEILKIVEKENRSFGGQSAVEAGENGVLSALTYIEKTLTQWKDFLPETKDTRNYRTPNKNYKYTVGNQVLGLPIKKQGGNQSTSLVRAIELPSAAGIFEQPGGTGVKPGAQNKDEDSDTDDEDMQNHPWTRQELRDKAVQSVAKRKKHRRTESSQPAGTTDQPRMDADSSALAGPAGTAATGADGTAELGYEDMVEKKDADEDSRASDASDLDDEAGPSDEEINEIFLKRYKMSREELQGMADKMGIQLNNLCYLKQEFDAYDDDHSGYIDVKELKELLEKLGEELSEGELDQAFRELDSDGSGEIEFFEFVEWFTSED